MFPGDPNLDTDSAVVIDTVTGEAVDTTAAAGAAAGGAGTSSSATTGATTGEKDDSSSSDASSSTSSDASGSAGGSTSTTSTSTTGGTGTGTTAAGVSVVQSTVYDYRGELRERAQQGRALDYVQPQRGRRLHHEPVGLRHALPFQRARRCAPLTRWTCSTIVNQLFGVDDDSSLHFDETLADLLKDNASRYAERSGFDDDLVDGFTGRRTWPSSTRSTRTWSRAWTP